MKPRCDKVNKKSKLLKNSMKVKCADYTTGTLYSTVYHVPTYIGKYLAQPQGYKMISEY